MFSANGKFGNPDRETLEMLAQVRGDDDYHVHLTYPIADIDANHKKDFESHHDNPWDAETQSLAAFLAANPEFEKRLVIAAEARAASHRVSRTVMTRNPVTCLVLQQ